MYSEKCFNLKGMFQCGYSEFLLLRDDVVLQVLRSSDVTFIEDLRKMIQDLV